MRPRGSPVRVLVADPATVHVETRTADWFVSGIRPERVAEAIDDGTSFGRLVETVRRLPGEYRLLCVDASHGTTVRAFRGLTATYDVYYARRPDDGTVVVGDHFRDVLAELPVEARTVHPDVAVDQLLLGCRPIGSYVEEVGRLGHGERLDWPRDGEPTTELVDTLARDGSISPSAAKRRLDRYFSDVLGDAGLEEATATMLSGGVDSTLLQTYVPTDATVSAAFDSPEFDFEVDYARQASRLLGADHELLTFDEADYRSYLERTIEAVGQPLLLPQGVLMYLIFTRSAARTYVNGYLADALFGIGTAALAYLARYLGPLSSLVPAVTWEAAALRETAAGFHRPATDPDGVAMNFRLHADQDHVAALVGRRAVDERKRHRLRYTLRRVPFEGGTGYAPHMHLGHAIEYFNDVAATNIRQAALAAGKSVVTPFAGRGAFETDLALPPARRYARFSLPPPSHPLWFVQHKYLLKDLLAERLPGYDTKRPKGHGQLPTGRYLADGPLADVFDRYPLPAFVPRAHRTSVREGTEEVTWYAANYAIWRDRVLENPRLERFETTRVVER